MALGPIPSWENQPDYLGAMSQGAKLGLDRASLEEQAKSAADRLRLGYAELAQKGASEAAAQSAAAQLHAAVRADSMAQFQQEQELKKAGFNLDAEHQLSEEGFRNKQLGMEQQRLDQSAQTPVSPLGKLYKDRDSAVKAGDLLRAKDYDAAIQESLTNKGRSIYMGQDDQGKPIFQMTEAGGKPIGTVGTPTVATQSMAQRKLLQYQNSTQLINYLQKNLKEEHVGMRGAAGQLLVDEALAQVVPEAANKDRVDLRSTMTAARESLLREISDDQRFSKLDREEIAKALPSNGVFESLPAAKQKLETVRRILAQRGKTYSQGLGQKPPLWSMDPEEIKSAFQKGEIKEDEAIDALTRFH